MIVWRTFLSGKNGRDGCFRELFKQYGYPRDFEEWYSPVVFFRGIDKNRPSALKKEDHWNMETVKEELLNAGEQRVGPC